MIWFGAPICLNAGPAGPIDFLARRPSNSALTLTVSSSCRRGGTVPEVILDLGDHSPGPVPGRGPILEPPVADQRGVARSAATSSEQILDPPHQDAIGWQADGVQDLVPPVRTMDIAWPELCTEAVAEGPVITSACSAPSARPARGHAPRSL